LIGPLVSYVQQGCVHMGLCDATECTRIGVALEEALANALFHGNLEVHSVLREADERAYWALVRRRLQESPYQDRRIQFRALLMRTQAIFEIHDQGPGFDPSSLPDPTDPANLEKACGRGVLLMRTFMDEVAYNSAGNTVTLTKHCAGRGKPGLRSAPVPSDWGQ
jgi:anti-sigma regulatory factor (Ser/Thr protein kinase)